MTSTGSGAMKTGSGRGTTTTGCGWGATTIAGRGGGGVPMLIPMLRSPADAGEDVLSIATAERVTTPDSLANPFMASPLRPVRSRGVGEVPSVIAQVFRVYGGI